MDKKQGGCQCGAVRYELKGDPLTCYACHCTDCQTASGSAFTLSMITNEHDMEVTNGEMATSTVDVNGVAVQRHACAHCGVGLWFSADAYPGIVALKPGTFDDTCWFTPIAHLWTRSAQPWVKLDNGIAKYEKQPEIAELIELWAKANH